MFETIRLSRKCRIIPAVAERYQTYGTTFQTNSLGTNVINTIDPENIQVIYSSNEKDWGVQPMRLSAMEPFCGRGFITTDGKTWERSRALLKPSFNKANITDLSAFKAIADRVLCQLPKDESTVDLSPILYELVSLR